MGIVFKLDTSGELSILHSFSGPDGMGATGPLLVDAAGNLFGTTAGGGEGSCDCGVLFKIDSDSKYTVLLSFRGKYGELPLTALVEDPGGSLYGVTEWGGDGHCFAPHGCGVLFQITVSGEENVLHTFGVDSLDGVTPDALILNEGTLYGATSGGGEFGLGTVFQYTLN